MTEPDTVDVVVVGGGVAGLQTALTLGRALLRVVVVDDGRPRNAPARHVHNFLAVPDTSPKALLDRARAMLADHDVRLCDDRVETVEGGEVRSARGRRWRARAVVLATGLTDELPHVNGVDALWGRDVVACPHCHGWEVRGEALGLLNLRGMADRAVQRAVLVSRWSDDIVLYTDGDDLTQAQRARLAAAGVAVCMTPVDHLDHDGERLRAVVLADGTRQERRAVFVVVRQHQTSDLGRRLGCAHGDDGGITTDASGRTTVPGVWAVGTTTAPALLAIGAAGHASSVAIALHNALTEADLGA